MGVAAVRRGAFMNSGSKDLGTGGGPPGTVGPPK
jgi:hypothetical protein